MRATHNHRHKTLPVGIFASLVLPTWILVALRSAQDQSGISAWPPHGAAGAGRAPSVLLPNETDDLCRIRSATLAREPVEVADLLKLLAHHHPSFVMTGLYAASRLGLSEALPEIDGVARKYPNDYYLHHFARTAHARLVAENNMATEADALRQASAGVRTILSELNLSPAQINSEVQALKQRKAQNSESTTEIYALREVADLMYRRGADAFAQIAEVNALDFTLDHAAALKVRLAPLTRDQRVAALVDELASKKILRGDDFFTIQLAIDEGKLASQSAAAKLKEMDANRGRYSHPGFSALFSVLHGIGDIDQAPTLEAFVDDGDAWVAHYAQIMYRDVARGIRHQYAPGF